MYYGALAGRTAAGNAAAIAAANTAPTSALASPDVFLRLRLPDDVAAAFIDAVEAARASLAARVGAVPWDEPWPDPSASASVQAARMFSIRARRVPAWTGLLALLEDWVDTWDPPDHGPAPPRAARTRPEDAVFARDGWRCMAPGCTSRRNLECHHVIYRSHGGGDGLANRVALCRFHHQRGEHGGLARCRGRAPLGIIWRLGAAPVGVWFRNERRLGEPRGE